MEFYYWIYISLINCKKINSEEYISVRKSTFDSKLQWDISTCKMSRSSRGALNKSRSSRARWRYLAAGESAWYFLMIGWNNVSLINSFAFRSGRRTHSVTGVTPALMRPRRDNKFFVVENKNCDVRNAPARKHLPREIRYRRRKIAIWSPVNARKI